MRVRVSLARLGMFLLAGFILAACDSVEERVQNHYDRGLELLSEDAPEKAALEFRNAIKLNADFAPAHYQLGLIQEDERNLTGAFRSFMLVTDLDEKHVDARVKVSRLYMLRNDLEDAREHLDEAIAIAPDNVGVLSMQVWLAVREEDFTAARAALDKALAAAPKDIEVLAAEVEYIRRAESETLALARVDEALKLAPEDLMLNIAKLQILASLKDTLAIGGQLQRLIDLEVDVKRFRNLLYSWAIDAKRYDVAEEQLRWFADQDPDEVEPKYNLVRFLQQIEGVEKAREELVAFVEKAKDKTRIELLLAKFDRDTGRRDDAVALLQDMIARDDSGSNQARTTYANMLLAEGDVDGALALVKEVIARDENNVEAIVIWGAHLLSENRLEEMVTAVRRGLNEQADDIRLLTLAARAQERLGNINLANDRYAAAMKESGFANVNVNNYIGFLSRVERYNAIEAVLSEAVRRRPDELEFLKQLGFARVQVKDWSGANQVARALDKTAPNESLRLRAAILVGQERFDEGESLLRNIVVEEKFEGTVALVQTYLAQGDLDAAVKYVDDLLEDDPNDTLALGLRGNLHLAVGEYDEAEARYLDVLKADPANSGAHSALMRVYAAAGKQDQAEAVLLDGLEKTPESLLLKTRLAQLRELQGRIDDAIALYDEVLSAAPNAMLAVNNYASLIADHRADNAKLLERAYRIAGRLRESSFPHYRDTFAWTRHLNGEHKEAKAAMDQVIKQLPNNAWIRYHYGMINAALGDTAAAIENLELALALAGDTDFPPREKVSAKLGELSGG